MKLFLDQGVPRRAAALLREAGADAVHAGEVGLSAADDHEIVAWCQASGATVVTLDADSVRDPDPDTGPQRACGGSLAHRGP